MLQGDIGVDCLVDGTVEGIEEVAVFDDKEFNNISKRLHSLSIGESKIFFSRTSPALKKTITQNNLFVKKIFWKITK